MAAASVTLLGDPTSPEVYEEGPIAEIEESAAGLGKTSIEGCNEFRAAK